jgi:formiminoglutamase
VVNGRFCGGWTTRHHGRPAEGGHAIQTELAQSAHMREGPPWAWDTVRAERLRPHLAQLLAVLDRLGRQRIPA